jgi:enoyl-CoA hydratase/carnithine racemase
MSSGDRNSTLPRRSVLKATATLAASALIGPAQAADVKDNAAPSGVGDNSPTVVLERRGSIFLMGLNRPMMNNMLDPPTYARLAESYRQLDEDPELRVGVLFGYGPSFCRGIDVHAFETAIAGGQASTGKDDQIDPFGKSKRRVSKPIVAVVHGDTWNIGHELMLSADIRVAAAGTKFMQMECTQARMPGSGATVRFVHDAGWGNAMRYMLTGDAWTAEDAYRMNLVQDVAPDQNSALARGLEIAGKIAGCAPLSIRATLTSAHRAIDPAEDQALFALNAQRTALYQTQDFREGLTANAERRRPVYQGR